MNKYLNKSSEKEAHDLYIFDVATSDIDDVIDAPSFDEYLFNVAKQLEKENEKLKNALNEELGKSGIWLSQEKSLKLQKENEELKELLNFAIKQLPTKCDNCKKKQCVTFTGSHKYCWQWQHQDKLDKVLKGSEKQ